MAKYGAGANAICPFFEKESAKSICCEGLVKDTLCLMRFRTELEKQIYQESHCDTYDYAAVCPMAAAIMRQKYSEEARSICITQKNKSR